MKTYRKTNYRIKQNNYHLKDILEEKYYIELGTIDIEIFQSLLNKEKIELKSIIYEDTTKEGVGQILNDASNELKYQFNFLNKLHYNTSSNKIFLTSGVIHYKLPSDENYKYAPIVLIPIEIDYQDFTLRLSSSPIYNSILYNDIQANLGISVGTLNEFPSLLDIFEYCNKFSRETNFDISSGNFITYASIEYLDNQIEFDDLTPQRSIYEKTSFEVQESYFKNIKAVAESNIYQKSVLQKINDGESFVVDGSFGSGKTYTIVNAICNAILKDKKVLYISSDSFNIKEIYRNLCIYQANTYSYILSKSVDVSNIIPTTLPIIREEKIGTETLLPIKDYEQAMEASINGCKYYNIVSRLAKIKNTNQDIIRIPIEVNLRNHEINKVYEELKDIEATLDKIEPLDINLWRNVEQYYSKSHVKEIEQNTRKYANSIREFNKEIKKYCDKYDIILPKNFISAQKLLSIISIFKKVLPPIEWINNYNSKKINEIINTISSFQTRNREIQNDLDSLVINDYVHNDVEELFNIILHNHLDKDNDIIEISNILKENDKIQETIKTIKSTIEQINKTLKIYKSLILQDNIGQTELTYFHKVYKLLFSTTIKPSWISLYLKHKNDFNVIFDPMKNLIFEYLKQKSVIRPYILKEEYLNYDYQKVIFSDRFYQKTILSVIDKKLMKKNKVSNDTMYHEFIKLYDIAQQVETLMTSHGLITKKSLDNFITNYNNWILFIKDLSSDELRIFNTQILNNKDLLINKHILSDLYKEYMSCEKLLKNEYKYLKNYGIEIKGETIIEKNNDVLPWLKYLKDVKDVNIHLKRIFKDKIPCYDDIILVINRDKEYFSLLENLNQQAALMKEYLGSVYLGLDTDCAYISILEKNYALFLKQLKSINSINKLYQNNLFEELIKEFDKINYLTEIRLTSHNQFSRYFVGGQYHLLEASLDESSILVNKYEERIREIEEVFKIFTYLKGFATLGLKDLSDGIKSAKYSKGISEVYIYSTYYNYQMDLINAHPILLEKNNILTWLDNFNYYERNYNQINIRALERNKKASDKKTSQHIKNIPFNDYNKIVDSLISIKNIFLGDLNILNSTLSLDYFDLVLVDDVHLDSANKYKKAFNAKQVVMFGDSIHSQFDVSNIFKILPKKYIFRLPEGYYLDNDSYGHEFNSKDNYIVDFKKSENIQHFNDLKEIVKDIVNKYYKDISKKFNIIVSSNNYMLALYQELVTKLKDLYSDEDIFNILTDNLKILKANKDANHYADEVFFLFDDLSSFELSEFKHMVKEYSIGVNKVNFYSLKASSHSLNVVIKELHKSKPVINQGMPKLTKIVYDALLERKVNVDVGFGRIDLMIKGIKQKNKEIPNIGIIIERESSRIPYSTLEDYEYYHNVFTKNNWQIFILYVDDIIENLDARLDVISTYLSKQNMQTMHQLKIDEFIN